VGGVGRWRTEIEERNICSGKVGGGRGEGGGGGEGVEEERGGGGGGEKGGGGGGQGKERGGGGYIHGEGVQSSSEDSCEDVEGVTSPSKAT